MITFACVGDDPGGCVVPGFVVVGVVVGFGALSARDGWPDQSLLHEVVEQTAQLGVAGFAGHEFVEARDVVKRWDAAAVVRWNTEVRVTDEEGEVELLERGLRQDGRIVQFLVPVFEMSFLLLAVDRAIEVPVGKTVDNMAIGLLAIGLRDFFRSNAFLGCTKGRGNFSWRAMRRYQIVRNILDEYALALSKRKS